MKIKNKIRKDVSQTFNILIPEGKWKQYMDMLDRDGHPTRRELMDLILVFSHHIEDLETHIENLYFQIDLLQGNNPTKTTEPEIKLRTPLDIKADLDRITTPQTKVYYLSSLDWKILEKTLNRSSNNPNLGLGQEVDPRVGVARVCMYHNDKPVFEKS